MSNQEIHEIIRLLQQTRGLLAFHRELGLDVLPRSAALESFLLGTPPASTRKSPAASDYRGPTPPHSQHKPAPAEQNFSLAEVEKETTACHRCPCGEGITRIPKSGGTASGLLIITDPPPAGATAAPLAGPADQLLTKMLAAIDLARETVYVTSLLKCPLDREPTPEELESCLVLLRREIAAATPRVICSMGPLAASTLLRSREPIFAVRGRFHTVRDLPLMPTFHPAYLLKNPEMKKAAWLDLQAIRKQLTRR
ncbi:MAG: uracil-DNA glycosylase [Deltaproteobacteria bacterium]